MMDPAHGAYGSDARVWRFVPEGEVIDLGDKAICRAGYITVELKLPKPTTMQRVEFGIRASLLVLQPADYRRWAARWLGGEDRSAEAAARAAVASPEWSAAAAAATAAWVRTLTSVGWSAEAAQWSAEAAWAAARAAEAENDDLPLPLPLASLALAVLEGRGDEFTEEWASVMGGEATVTSDEQVDQAGLNEQIDTVLNAMRVLADVLWALKSATSSALQAAEAMIAASEAAKVLTTEEELSAQGGDGNE